MKEEFELAQQAYAVILNFVCDHFRRQAWN